MTETQLYGLEWQGLGEWGPRLDNIEGYFPHARHICQLNHSAISMIHPTIDSVRAGEHPMVCLNISRG